MQAGGGCVDKGSIKVIACNLISSARRGTGMQRTKLLTLKQKLKLRYQPIVWRLNIRINEAAIQTNNLGNKNKKLEEELQILRQVQGHSIQNWAVAYAQKASFRGWLNKLRKRRMHCVYCNQFFRFFRPPHSFFYFFFCCIHFPTAFAYPPP